MSNTSMKKMFKHQGKTVNVIGKSRVKTYEELFNSLSKLQIENSVPVHENYLGDNDLAQNIYKKKYLLKDLDNELIESSPEDVFKRLSSFIATVEETKSKQKKWSKKFYEELFEGHFIPGGRVLAGAIQNELIVQKRPGGLLHQGF